MFAYYAQWITKNADKIKLLVQTKSFLISEQVLQSYNELKKCLIDATLGIINDKKHFTIETDASEVAILDVLNQENKQVAFFSRSLNSIERHHLIIEKKATAFVEAVWKCSHFLQGHRFKIVTDPKSVLFIYDNKSHSKVKNDKILRWPRELSQYDYEIIY